MASLLTGTPATTQSTSTSQLPQWLTDFYTQVLGQGLAVGAEPYQPYQAPRIAPFTPTQQRSMELTTGFGEQAAPLFGTAVGAAERAATPFSAGALSPFMNPYTSGVVDEVGRRGMENLSNVRLPGVSSGFIAAGAPGSRRALEAQGKTISETMREIAGVQGGLLERGYTGALSAYGQEQERQRAAAQQLASMAQTGVSGMAQVGGAEQALGQQSLKLAYEDFLRQQGDPMAKLQQLAQLASGVKAPASTTQVGTETPAGDSTLTDISKIISIFGGLFGTRGGGETKQARGGHIRRWGYRRGGKVRYGGALAAVGS